MVIRQKHLCRDCSNYVITYYCSCIGTDTCKSTCKKQDNKGKMPEKYYKLYHRKSTRAIGGLMPKECYLFESGKYTMIRDPANYELSKRLLTEALESAANEGRKRKLAYYRNDIKNYIK